MPLALGGSWGTCELGTLIKFLNSWRGGSSVIRSVLSKYSNVMTVLEYNQRHNDSHEVQESHKLSKFPSQDRQFGPSPSGDELPDVAKMKVETKE